TLVAEAKSPDDLAKGYRKLLSETTALWGAGKLAWGERTDLVDALLASPVIAALPSPVAKDADDRDRLARLIEEADRLEQKLPGPRRGLAIADGSDNDDRVHLRGNPKTLGEVAPRQLP